MGNSKFSKKNAKNRKLEILKIPNVVLRGPIGGKIRRNFKVLAATCWRSNFLNFWLLLGPMLTKTNQKKIVKFQFSKFPKFCKFSKVPNVVL